MNIFIYKLTTDNGGAPCVQDGLLSLCICKPRIRRSARVGDWIIGMGAKGSKALRNRIIYIAQITNTVAGQLYYSEKQYRERNDCIYQINGGRFSWKKGSKYHSPGDLEHDLGQHPKYNRASCLLSDRFIYFGDNDEPSIKPIRDIYDRLPRDYRKNHSQQNLNTLLKYIATIESQYGYGKHGSPSHLSLKKKCYKIEDGIFEVKRSREKTCRSKHS